jgi:3-isopropylmalate/(R)-2-methylmalate dehydratase large subunit
MCWNIPGSAIRALSMEERMTVCNMSIEAGARAGMIAPDDTTYDYLRGREFVPGDFERAVAKRGGNSRPMKGQPTTRLASFNADDVAPQVTWGTNPGQVAPVKGRVPDPGVTSGDPTEQKSITRALEYMGLKPGTP